MSNRLHCWETNDEVLDFIEDQERPSPFTNDLVIEIYKRTIEIKIKSDQLSKKYWHRQIKEKQRKIESLEEQNEFTKGKPKSKFLEIYYFNKSDKINFYLSEKMKEKISVSENSDINPEKLNVKMDFHRKNLEIFDKKTLEFIESGILLVLQRLLLGPYRKQPWLPFLHCFLHFLEFSYRNKELIQEKYNFISIISRKQQKRNESVLEILINQIEQLKENSIEFLTTFNEFFTILLSLNDENLIDSQVQKLICEAILKPFYPITSNRLNNLFTFYKVPLKVIS